MNNFPTGSVGGSAERRGGGPMGRPDVRSATPRDNTVLPTREARAVVPGRAPGDRSRHLDPQLPPVAKKDAYTEAAAASPNIPSSDDQHGSRKGAPSRESMPIMPVEPSAAKLPAPSEDDDSWLERWVSPQRPDPSTPLNNARFFVSGEARGGFNGDPNRATESVNTWLESWSSRSAPEPLLEDTEFFVRGDSRNELKESLRAGFDARDYTFNGDLDRAAELVEAFKRGRDYVHTTYAERDIHFDIPEPVMVTNVSEVGFTSDVALEPDRGFVSINADKIAAYSKYLPEEPIKKWNNDGNILFQGTLRQLFELGGVEETHHKLYIERRGQPANVVTPDVSDVYGKYDSQDHEFLALQWQIRYARQNGMGEETIKPLTDRLQAAKAIRRAARQHGEEGQ